MISISSKLKYCVQKATIQRDVSDSEGEREMLEQAKKNRVRLGYGGAGQHFSLAPTI